MPTGSNSSAGARAPRAGTALENPHSAANIPRMLRIEFEDQSAELDLDGYNHSDDDIRVIVARHFDVAMERVQAYEIDRYGRNVVFRPCEEV